MVKVPITTGQDRRTRHSLAMCQSYLSQVLSTQFIYSFAFTYSKLSVIRPGHSRLLEFGKKILSTGCLIETFSKYPDQVV